MGESETTDRSLPDVTMPPGDPAARRGAAGHVLLLAPDAPDGPLAEAIIREAGIAVRTYADVTALLAALACGAGAAIITAEALDPATLTRLRAWVSSQPTWSEQPVVLLTQRDDPIAEPRAVAIMEALANVAFLERPFHPLTLVTVVRAALRARQRQYDMRDTLAAREAASARLTESEQALRRLNETLEERVAAEIAARESAQADLVQAQKMDAMGRLTGGIAHDFNNLLTAILGDLDLISGRATDPALLRLADAARATAIRGTKLTAQLLAFARKKPLDLRPVAVDTLISGMRDLLARSLGSTIRVRTDFAVRAAQVIADPDRLQLALLNLAINARDAMPEGGELLIATHADTALGACWSGEAVAITVTDTGHGMSPEVRDRAFDPFFTTKPEGKGTGLGLSQVYTIVRQCGGTVRLASSVGQGTSVTIVLRRDDTAPAAALAVAPVVSRVIAGQREHVVIVDDQDDVRRFLAEALADLGYRVSEARDGVACLAALPAGPRPDLLVIDVSMPGMSGYELADRVRGLVPDVPILYATGHDDEPPAITRGPRARVLRKPFRIAELAAAIRDQLERIA